MSETSELVLPALVALWKRFPDGLWLRRNVGGTRYTRTSGAKRFVRFGMAGMSDIQGIWRGLAWELEAKLPGENLLESQVNWSRAVQRAGGVFIMFHDVGGLLATIDRSWRGRVERDRQAPDVRYGA